MKADQIAKESGIAVGIGLLAGVLGFILSFCISFVSMLIWAIKTEPNDGQGGLAAFVGAINIGRAVAAIAFLSVLIIFGVKHFRRRNAYIQQN